MAYQKYTKKSSLTDIQKYKRQQEKQRLAREKREKLQAEYRAPGGFLNPITPKFCKYSEFPTIRLSTSQVRYRGTTDIIAHLKGTEPQESYCPMTGSVKKTEISAEQYKAYLSNVGQITFGTKHYKHPITIVSYEDFCKNYSVYIHFDAYLD